MSTARSIFRTGPLSYRDYRLLLGGFALGQLLMPLQFLTQILWVQANAPRDIWLILVAMIGASRGVGALTFGLYGGALADRFDRRRMLVITHALLVGVTIAIAGLMYADIGSALGFTLFFALTFLAGGLQAVDMPTRLALVPDLLGPEHTPAGMALNQVVGQLAMPLAMLATGFIIDELGFSGAYLVSALGHIAVIAFLLQMHYRRPPAIASETRYGARQAFDDVRAGLAYARNHSVVLWVIVLLITMMGLGFPVTANLGPTWITTVVGVATRDLGFVVMTWGIGSLIAAVVLMRFASAQGRGRWIAGGAVLFCVSFMVFVGDTTVANAVIGNLGLGAGMTLTSVSSVVLIQHVVPNEVRGRIMSIFQLNMGFAQLMTMPVAMLAQWLTLPVLFPAMALVTTVAVLGIVVTQRQLVQA